MAEDTVPTRRPLNKKGAAFIKKLDKERVKNANTSARSKGTSSSGTFGSSERMADVKKDRGVQRGKGELVKRPDYSVTEYKKPGTSVVEVKKPGTAVVEYKGPSASTAASNVAGKALGRGAMRFLGPAGALVGMTEETNKGEREFMDMIRKKAGKGYGDKPVGPFKPAQTTIAVRKEYPGSNTGNRAVRKASGTYTASYDAKEAPKAKSETPKVKSATIKTATDKSRIAPKMTNYQRMQAKQLEKEGYAGRSLTRAQAQKMAGAKSASNTSSLMSLFGISKKKTETPKATSKRTGPLKSAFAQISYQGRKK